MPQDINYGYLFLERFGSPADFGRTHTLLAADFPTVTGPLGVCTTTVSS